MHDAQTMNRIPTELAGVWRYPGLADYESVWRQMQTFTEWRSPDQLDELWLVQHRPVYTLGQAGKPEHLLNPGNIPVIQTDRGGQVTFHGPGQAIVYVLAELKRTGQSIREMVQSLEEAVIQTLTAYGVALACRKPGAPGVYVPQADGSLAKIAALGIKVRKGCTYHGVALNVDMDLTPYEGINPCGYAGLETISMAKLGILASCDEVALMLSGRIIAQCRLRVE